MSETVWESIVKVVRLKIGQGRLYIYTRVIERLDIGGAGPPRGRASERHGAGGRDLRGGGSPLGSIVEHSDRHGIGNSVVAVSRGVGRGIVGTV